MLPPRGAIVETEIERRHRLQLEKAAAELEAANRDAEGNLAAPIKPVRKYGVDKAYVGTNDWMAG